MMDWMINTLIKKIIISHVIYFYKESLYILIFSCSIQQLMNNNIIYNLKYITCNLKYITSYNIIYNLKSENNFSISIPFLSFLPFQPGKYAADLPHKTDFDINKLTQKQIIELINDYAYAARYAQQRGQPSFVSI